MYSIIEVAVDTMLKEQGKEDMPKDEKRDLIEKIAYAYCRKYNLVYVRRY